jgi:acyl-coenzyme A thioesterase PaaI-like protein
MKELVSIDRRFRGPPDSGNGGYVAGLLANSLGGSDCRVTLLKPPPLAVPLRIERTGDNSRLLDGDDVIATAARAAVSLEVPAPPSEEEAQAAERRFSGLTHHIFPGCFVCGPEREEGDGLRIFAGPSRDQVASTWRPRPDLAGADGAVRVEFVWAALDCPGYFAVQNAAGLAVLGTIAATLRAPVRAGELAIVTGWPIATEGRKHRVGTAIHGADGTLLASAQATWITLRAAG